MMLKGGGGFYTRYRNFKGTSNVRSTVFHTCEHEGFSRFAFRAQARIIIGGGRICGTARANS